MRIPKFLALALGVIVATPVFAEDNISFVTNWGKDVYSPAFMLRWADRFNAENEGVAKINYVGGPEVTPAREQLTATRNGVFDMLFGAAGYYVGQVPEGYVFYATSMTPMEARESGAFDVLADVYREKAHAEVLGWVAAGVGYNIWLKDPDVPVSADGLPDLSGLKIRSSPFYNAWLESMGATVVPVSAPDIYSALERGVVDGAAWPALGITDFGWNKFIGARIDPAVWQFDNLLMVNLDAWNNLSSETQGALKASIAALESEAYDFYAGLAEEERVVVEDAGTRPFVMSDAARDVYVKAATDLMWAQLEKVAPENYERLRAAFGG